MSKANYSALPTNDDESINNNNNNPAPTATTATPEEQQQQQQQTTYQWMKGGVESTYATVKKSLAFQPARVSTETPEVVYPINGSYTGEMLLDIVTFSEVDACVDDAVIYSTVQGVQALCRELGPKYHIPIYVGTTILLVAGGVIVGVIAAAVAGAYFHYARKRARTAIESFLSTENAKAVYREAGITWRLNDEGIVMTYDSWEIVTTTTTTTSVKAAEAAVVAATPTATPAVPNMYANLTGPPAGPPPQFATLASAPTQANTPAYYSAAPVQQVQAPVQLSPAATTPNQIESLDEEEALALAIARSRQEQ